MENSEIFCKAEIERMLKNSQSKVIMPVIALGLLKAYSATGAKLFSDSEIRKTYQSAVKDLKRFLGHDIHIGAKYEDAYGMRMSRYGVLKTIGHLKYELLVPYLDCAKTLSEWIPARIKQHIDTRLGIIPLLHHPNTRVSLAENQEQFLNLIQQQIDKTPTNFEIFSFAIMKVHLEKFACKDLPRYSYCGSRQRRRSVD
ncbi:MAG: hypothetical protein ABR557_11845 [Pyrinomonadaceae bacterium]